MKRAGKIGLIFVLVLVLVSLGTVHASDLSSVYPVDSFIFARIVMKDRLEQLAEFDSLPNLTAAVRKMVALMAAKAGFNPLSDVEDAGFFVMPEFTMQAPVPNNLAFFIRGNFNSETFITVVPEICKGMGVENRLEFMNIGGKKSLAVVTRTITVFFLDENTLVIAASDLAARLSMGKIKFGSIPGSFQTVASTNKTFIAINFARIERDDFEAALEKTPEAIAAHLKNLTSAIFVPENDTIYLTAEFSSPENASFIGSSLEALRSHAVLEIENQLKNSTSGLEDLPFAELFQNKCGQFIAFSAGKDLISCLKFSHDGLNLHASVLIPPSIRGSSLIAIVAAIAMPNFKKAREQARLKACYANQRVILGAVEMYNMDNAEMITGLKDEDVRESGLLVRGKYLKSPVISPEPDCYYQSQGDLSGTGTITCTRHGSFDGGN